MLPRNTTGKELGQPSPPERKTAHCVPGQGFLKVSVFSWGGGIWYISAEDHYQHKKWNFTEFFLIIIFFFGGGGETPKEAPRKPCWVGNIDQGDIPHFTRERHTPEGSLTET